MADHTSDERLWWETGIGFAVAAVGGVAILWPIIRGDDPSTVRMVVGLVLVAGGCTWINKLRAGALLEGAVDIIRAWRHGNGGSR